MNPVQDRKALGKDLLALREKLRLTQAEMGAATGTAVELARTAEDVALDTQIAAESDPILYVTIRDRQQGPFSLSQLRELQKSGQVNNATTVRFEDAKLAGTIGHILGQE